MPPHHAKYRRVAAGCLSAKNFSARHLSARRGIFVIDAVSGLMLMLATLALLAIVTTRAQIVGTRLTDDRAAIHLAESTMLQLANRSETPVSEGVEVLTLAAKAPAGHRWVSVTATVGGRHASLIGLAHAAPPATTEASR